MRRCREVAKPRLASRAGHETALFHSQALSNLGNAGRVIHVYRKKYIIHIDKITREKANGATVHIPIHPSKVSIVKLKLDRDRRSLIDRKAEGRARVIGIAKGKHTEQTIAD